jgi:hypothetical protein
VSTHRASTTNSGGFRAVPKPAVPYQRVAPATVGEQAARQGWAPAPRSAPAHTPPRGQRAVAPGDGAGLRVLRTVTYVLASVASLLFILLVAWGVVAYIQLSTELPRLFGG